MSQEAMDSEWVILERNTTLFRDPNNSRRRLIPLKLDDCQIPTMLQRFRYADWTRPSKRDYDTLIDLCRPFFGLVIDDGIAVITLRKTEFEYTYGDVAAELREEILPQLDSASLSGAVIDLGGIDLYTSFMHGCVWRVVHRILAHNGRAAVCGIPLSTIAWISLPIPSHIAAPQRDHDRSEQQIGDEELDGAARPGRGR
jgi:hypothetical protein